MITKQSCIYDIPAVENATSAFSVFIFFQHFDRNIIETFCELVQLYMKFENFSKKMEGFEKILRLVIMVK